MARSESAYGTLTERQKHPGRSSGSFAEWRTIYDSLVLRLFWDRTLRRVVKEQSKTNLETLWVQAVRKLERDISASRQRFDPLEIHLRIVEGLPGEALFLSSAMLFDSMAEALELFDISAKTARQRIGERLSSGESEIALRIGRVLTMASDVFGSLSAAREYLRAPNFALGGVAPRELLKTAEGEQLVLSELKTQADGGPV
jgi:putative toxin-antitoxin system antitoxin component (TIGR02293 family)